MITIASFRHMSKQKCIAVDGLFVRADDDDPDSVRLYELINEIGAKWRKKAENNPPKYAARKYPL